MIINPIISLWIMIPISILFAFFILAYSTGTKVIIRFVLLVLLFVINLRIMIPNGSTLVYGNNLDIIFVVDSTISMDAEDVKPSRLEKAKSDINYIMDKTAGANYASISYDNNAYIRMVMTKDADAIAASIDSITVIEEFYARGTKVTRFKDKLEELLLKENKKKDVKVIVYIFTDGENTSGVAEDDLSYLKQYIDGGAILGYGTKEGSGIKVSNYTGEREDLYYYDDHYNRIKAHTKLDADNMKKIGKSLGIEYIHMTNTNDIDDSLKNLNKIKVSNDDEGKKYAYKDTYYFLTPLVGVILLIELYGYRKVRL